MPKVPRCASALAVKSLLGLEKTTLPYEPDVEDVIVGRILMDHAREPEADLVVVAVVIHAPINGDLVAHRHRAGRAALAHEVLDRERLAGDREGRLAAVTEAEIVDRQPLDVEIRRLEAPGKRVEDNPVDGGVRHEGRFGFPVARLAPVAADGTRPFGNRRILIGGERTGDRRIEVPELILGIDGVISTVPAPSVRPSVRRVGVRGSDVP